MSDTALALRQVYALLIRADMSPVLTRANVLIADARPSPWSTSLARSLRPLPVDLHWSRSDTEAIGLVSDVGVHLAVIDGDLPGGGLNLLRRVRRLGLEFPCLLVCDGADQRLLSDALELDVFSVMARAQGGLLAPMVFKVFRQVYRVDWPDSDWGN